MRLVRPAVFHPRIVLAGYSRHTSGDGDDAGLVAALRHRGLHARWLSWDDPDTGAADLVILRATRDYAERLDEFLAWTTGVANLLNPPAVVAWNADRRYLDDLSARGVATVPGEIFAPGERVPLPRTGPVFVGPATGSGTHRCRDRAEAAAAVAEMHAAGRGVLIQPAAAAPETALVFLRGEPSHALTKRGQSPVVVDADFEIWDVGADALAAAAAETGIATSDLLYARAHVIGGVADPRLLELQLVDPSLGWRRLDADTREDAQREFALAVESALERLGLGPLSH
jgi:hypothetical protein